MHNFAFQGLQSKHNLVKDNIMRDAGQGSTQGLAHATGPKPKYDKHPALGICGMSGLRGFTDDLLVKT